MIDKKDWSEFRNTGLVLIINQLLHVFGWAIVYEYDDVTNEITSVYPARVKFRGFDNQAVSDNYTKVTEYIHKNANDLLSEVLD
jgi:hypothetical protein